jgi:hypothetical protein
LDLSRIKRLPWTKTTLVRACSILKIERYSAPTLAGNIICLSGCRRPTPRPIRIIQWYTCWTETSILVWQPV